MKFFTSVFYIHRIGWPIIESVLCVLGDRKLLGWDNYNNNNGRHELHTSLRPVELHICPTLTCGKGEGVETVAGN